MKKTGPQRIDLTPCEAEALIERIQSNHLTEEDKKAVVGVIRFCLWLQVKLFEA